LSCRAHNKLNVRLPAGSTLEFELQNEEKIVKNCAYKVTTEEDIGDRQYTRRPTEK